MKRPLTNEVTEGTYETRVGVECSKLGGQADIDVYSTSIISGVIDLTFPEQYGQALPLQKYDLIGEEVVVICTEPVRCKAFNLLSTVGNGSLWTDHYAI